MNEAEQIIIDLGSRSIKAGPPLDTQKPTEIPSMVGSPVIQDMRNKGKENLLQKEYVGKWAMEKKLYLDLRYPFKDLHEGREKGETWSDIEKILCETFTAIKMPSARRNVLLTEPANDAISKRTKLVQIMFEKFDVGGLQFAKQSVVPLLPLRQMTGMIVDIGEIFTTCSPVVDFFVQPMSIQKQNLAGYKVSQYLMKLLQLRGLSLGSQSDLENIYQIKEKECFVSPDFHLQKKISSETCFHMRSFELPDRRIIRFGEQRFEASEILFRPEINRNEGKGLAELIDSCLQKCDISSRGQLISNIILIGGTSLIPGMAFRLQNDLNAIYAKKKAPGSTTSKIRILSSNLSQYYVFQGASMYSEMLKKQNMWVTRKQYSEQGVDRLAKKMNGEIK